MAQGTTKGVPIDLDPLLANNSDLLVPSQKAVKTYIDNASSGKVSRSGDTMSGYLILNNDPLLPLGAATKNYVDTLINGIDWKQSVYVATVASLPTYTVTLSGQVLTGTTNGAIPSATTDGVSVSVNQRILVKNETSTLTPNNGIYIVTQVGSGSLPFILTRAADANTSALLSEATLSIINGSTLSNTQWHCNPATIPLTIGTTYITFAQIGGTAAYTFSSPLVNTSNVISIPAASTSIDGYLTATNFITFNNKQAGSANLTSLSGLSYSSLSFVKMTGANTFVLDTAVYAVDSSVVHIAGTETITGAKTFSSNVIMGSAGFRYDNSNSAVGIGLASAPSTNTYLEIAASTATKSSIRFNSGVTVTSPAAGDLWYTGGLLYFNNGTTTIALSNGTITSVSGTGTVSGLTLTGSGTSGAVTLTLGGTLSVVPSNFAAQSQNTFLAGPTSGTATPTFRTITTGDLPATLTQNTTGSAATLTTARNIYGNSFNGSSDLTQIIASTYGGTGNGFTKFTGATATEKTYTLPDVSTTILTTNNLVTVAQGGTGANTLTGVLIGTGTAAISTITGTNSQLLRRNAGNTAYEFFTPTYVSSGDTFFIGTTSIANNRTSGTQSLTGITSIDGSAGSVANTITFNTTGGVVPGTSYNGSAARIIDYTSVGAAAASHTHAWSAITSGLPTTISGYGITDAYTKTEIDNFLQGLDPKASVIAATTGVITLSGTQTIDGVAVVAGNRVLVKNQTTTSENGIYVVSATAWSRSTDADSGTELINAYVFVEQGTANKDTAWVCTNDTITINSTAVTFVQFAGSGAYQSVLNGTGYVKMSGTTLNYIASIPIADLASSTISGISLGGNLNNVTFNNSGTGSASGATYNGSAAVTISYNSIGAQPLATNLTSLAGLTWSTGTTPFVKMTGANTFTLDTTTYISTITLTGDVTATAGNTTIANSVVTLAKMANLTANTIIGNNTGTAATPLALTGTQVTAMLDSFAGSTKGLVPVSVGGTTNFLRADGSWAAPAGGGGSSTAPLVSKGGAFTIDAADANNTHYIMNVSPVAVTNAAGNGTTITYTASGGYISGQLVTIKGVVPIVYNLTNAVIASVGAGQFTVTNSATGTFTTSGTALSNNVITIPSDANATISVGYEYKVTSIGTGDIVFSPQAGVTLTSATGSYTMSGQYSSARLVKSAANVWRLYIDAGVVVFNRQYSSAYTLTLQDSNKIVEMNVDQATSAVNTVTIPLNSSVPFPIGTQIIVSQYGTSNTIISPTGGVIIRSTSDAIQLVAQYSSVTMVKLGTDEWYIYGGLVRKNDLQVKALATAWSNAAGTANGYQDVSGLSFPIVASGVYYFKFTVWYNTTAVGTSAMFSINTITATIATSGLRYTSSYYAGAAAGTAITSPTVATNTNLTAVNTPATTLANFGINVTTSGYGTAIVEGYIRVGTTGGSLVLRAASELATINTLQIVSGSFVQYVRLV
jgi:hypothetical protein